MKKLVIALIVIAWVVPPYYVDAKFEGMLFEKYPLASCRFLNDDSIIPSSITPFTYTLGQLLVCISGPCSVIAISASIGNSKERWSHKPRWHYWDRLEECK